ncbi:beta-hydroxyacyl-(Acyl-carrier-protein) dehydratase FabZ [Candidatus Arthromitus sp. SFB-mouse-Japan]|jgi:beta-hydroxyacyl-[acyl carrier protein] dehydratase FabZ|uniref:3-hydroxyacyl-ACP dehydratase FabZ n=1 Tax=Candidatus Arthromitus sp. SFB-mouse TaxID=49118 RepID=UPI00021B7D49|nr:3-hydroxyacyl-ACP dehydratase FabZ [Candidatus Arthromitus sp. SFB-mouse]EIA24190.1 (3R)-hydroxymyristoyl-[acyl-carrier-protein] dehydratase [Candidatus Arthromitus sp. SFB-2]EIA24465.1 (3R)-hydroxymyristoyl-[acyl-carrier-protein] dehydratase [Candidatus Arthromitus sp. SFB-1]EIA27747.1 (3R)-hydroxymyristoyl-[acyl-carrier-protein] dehydratase [Candidatus Arthromitus sp. SFB-co]EIA28164.1 (3R)-hydroxymyristoyl-[acyl-carrier-protein] dehydratase [Candidatus Arthromitus sp. SFB-5]EIA30178.1 Pu
MKKVLDITEILKIIPHRYPFLLIDKIIDMTEKTVTAIKNVTFNENFFQGHFPDQPVMPGVLILEALAQTGAAAILASEENRGKIAFFAGADKIKFRKIVVPGDVLELKCEILKMRSSFGKAEAVAKVDGEIACEAEIMFAIK